MYRRGAAPLLVAAVTAAVFLPSLRNGFVSWDDWRTLIENPGYRGLGPAQLRWMLTTDFFCNYQPLTWMTFGLDFTLWGMRPFGYHLTSLLLHCANAVAFYFLCLALRGGGEVRDEDRWGAAFAAFLFSLHPLRVEPVVWASARRDLVSGLFFLLALLAWLRSARPSEPRPRRWLAAAIAAYFLSLMSKAAALAFPAVLVLLDVYPLKRRGRWVEKIPFAALSLIFAAIGAAAQSNCGALLTLAQSGAAARISHAAFGFVFYLGKTAWPAGLSPLYEHNAHGYAAVLAVGAGALAGLCVLARTKRLRPAAAAAVVYYLLMLGPVLAVQMGRQRAADRYSYLSCLAWPLLAGAGLSGALRNRKTGRASAVSAALLLGVLSLQTVRQQGVWADSVTLWRTVLRLDPDVNVGRPNLADALLERHRDGEAILYLEEQTRLFPDDRDSAARLARLIAELGVTRLDHARFHRDLANENALRGETEKAAWHERKALSYESGR